MKKSPLKIIGIVLIIVLLLIGGAIAALYILLPPQKIVALVIPQAEKALGRQVSLKKAGISLFPRIGVSLSGLEVANTQREGFSKEAFVLIDKFTVSIAVMSIFKGYPEITSIIIRKPEIRIEVDKKGAYNFDDLAVLAKDTTRKQKTEPPQGPPRLPVPITLTKLAIENGVIVYNDQKSGNQIVIGSLNETIAVSMDKELRNIKTTGDLVLGNVSVKTKDIKKPLSNLRITLSHDVAANLADAGGAVTVNKVRLSLQKIFIELKGSVKNAMTPAPELDLAIASDPISLADALREVPVELAPVLTKLSGSGTIVLGLAVKGALAPKAPLPILGSCALNNITIKFAGMPQAINNLNADIGFTENSLAIKSLKMRFGTNPIELKATVNNFKKPLIDAALLADVKLGEIKDIMQLPKDAMLDGRIIADIKAKGEADPADPTKLDLKGLVNLQNVKMIWSPLLKPAEITGALTLSSKAVGQNMSVHIGNSSFTMATTITNFLSYVLPDKAKKLPRTNVDLKLTSPFLNVDEILMPKPPASKTGEPKNKAAAAAPAPIAPLPSVDVKALVTANKFIYQGFTMNNLVAKINILNDIAVLDFTTGFAGGTIGTVMNADMRNTHNVVFKNTLTIKSIEVNDLLQRFGGYIKPVTPLNRELASINKCLFGRINLQSTITGNGGTTDALMKSLTGNIGTQMGNGKLMNAPAARVASGSFAKFLKSDKVGNLDVINIRDLAASVRLANSQAIFDNLKIMSDLADWSAKGKVGFDALMDMAVSSRFNKDLSGRLLAVEGTLKSGLKGALEKTQFAGAAGLLDKINMIPRDNEGRVTLTFGLGGPVSSPTLTGLAFGAGTTGAVAQKTATPQQQVREKVQQAVEEKKQQLQQKVEQKKEETVKKAEDQIKQTAKDKLKGLWK